MMTFNFRVSQLYQRVGARFEPRSPPGRVIRPDDVGASMGSRFWKVKRLVSWQLFARSRSSWACWLIWREHPWHIGRAIYFLAGPTTIQPLNQPAVQSHGYQGVSLIV